MLGWDWISNRNPSVPMIRLFITNAAVKAVSLVVRVFMWVSRRKCYLIVPYPKNTARVVPVAWIAFVFRIAVKPSLAAPGETPVSHGPKTNIAPLFVRATLLETRYCAVTGPEKGAARVSADTWRTLRGPVRGQCGQMVLTKHGGAISVRALKRANSWSFGVARSLLRIQD
jgi:hypothetical protein